MLMPRNWGRSKGFQGHREMGGGFLFIHHTFSSLVETLLGTAQNPRSKCAIEEPPFKMWGESNTEINCTTETFWLWPQKRCWKWLCCSLKQWHPLEEWGSMQQIAHELGTWRIVYFPAFNSIFKLLFYLKIIWGFCKWPDFVYIILSPPRSNSFHVPSIPPFQMDYLFRCVCTEGVGDSGSLLMLSLFACVQGSPFRIRISSLGKRNSVSSLQQPSCGSSSKCVATFNSLLPIGLSTGVVLAGLVKAGVLLRAHGSSISALSRKHDYETVASVLSVTHHSYLPLLCWPPSLLPSYDLQQLFHPHPL